jgi:hypothetical protein
LASFLKDGVDTGVDEAVIARIDMKMEEVKIRSRKG